MLFNTVNFLFFFTCIFGLYWSLKGKYKLQNLLLLMGSYFFYGCWDYRFLFLLVFSTLLDYFTAIKISSASKIQQKKIWFWISIIINLGFLCVFKYFNFFADSFKDLFSFFGVQINIWTLKVILPVGISFYTFHGLSYVIDVYKERIKPERNFIDYSVFVSYFPLLVAGPIERATHLLPQIQRPREFNYAKAIDGLRQILWGLFKKIVIADNCAEFANEIFNNSETYQGSTLVVGALFFTFQIYADFSGYSDIALGVSRLLGIELLRNFSFPYFSRDIAEFWRRWHISLSSWFRDYLYIPLGGSKGKLSTKIRNTFVIFIVSGFWHGANWTFLFWGLLNAIYFLPLLLKDRNRDNIDIVAMNRVLPSYKDVIKISTTFCLVVFAWIFFRAESLTHAFKYIADIFNEDLFKTPQISERGFVQLFLIIVFLAIEWFGRRGKYALESLLNNFYFPFRWLAYIVIIFMIIGFEGKEQDFIYFQF